MIYWILHKKLTQSDWNNPIEGTPGYFYASISNITFLDITNYTFFAKAENVLLKTNKDNNIVQFGISENRYILIENKRQFFKFAKTISQNDLFLFQSLSDIRTIEFLKELNTIKAKTAVFNHWKLPIATAVPMNRDKRFIKNVFKKNPKLLFLRFLFRIYKRFEKNSLVITYALSSGTKMLLQLQKNFTVQNVVPVHSVTYDEYLRANATSTKPSLPYSYFVFIDQALTIHPDNKGFSENDTHSYQKELFAAFKTISKENGNCKIVIAEHPRCQYDKSFWKQYDHFSGNTATLIKYADGVIGHFSTALALAQIYKKKIILLTSSSSYFPFSSRVKNAQTMLDASIFNMKTLQEEWLCEKSAYPLTDFFTAIPDSTESNNELFIDFFNSVQQTQDTLC